MRSLGSNWDSRQCLKRRAQMALNVSKEQCLGAEKGDLVGCEQWRQHRCPEKSDMEL